MEEDPSSCTAGMGTVFTAVCPGGDPDPGRGHGTDPVIVRGHGAGPNIVHCKDGLLRSCEPRI